MTNIPPNPAGSSSERSPGSNSSSGPVQNNSTFSIATPAVTQINENLSDASFMHPTHMYHQETTVGSQRTNLVIDEPNEVKREPIAPISSVPDERGDSNGTSLDQSSYLSGEPTSAASQDVGNKSASPAATNSPKKKNKTSKKSLKLDTKSKLEKSRQSARECRARKKLRYQYLEDLVCNREKAVVKLREELTMFCEMSERMLAGVISENDRGSLVEQTKEKNLSA